jgi:hypothetical protein
MPIRWLVVLAAVVLAGCGSEPRLSANTANAMHADVKAARTAAGSGDRDAAVAALESLGKRVAKAESDGELSSEAAAALRRGAARARRRAASALAAPQPTPATTASPTPTPTPTPTSTATTTPAPTATSTAAPPAQKPGKGPKSGNGGKKEKGGKE